MQKNAYNVYAVFVIPILVFFYFWTGAASLPKADQHWFIRQQAFNHSDSNYFLNSLAYNRTRSIMKGKYDFLFRPAMHGTLALEVIFLQDYPYLLGIMGLLLHIGVALLLFFILKKILSQEWALLLSALFAVHVAGSEMFLWQHITPYIGSLFFFGLGSYQFAYAPKNSRSTALYFLVACFFHEAAAMGLLFLSAYFFITEKKGLKKVYPLLIPAAIFFFINIAHAAYSGFFSHFSQPTSENGQSFNFIEGLLQFAGMAFSLFWIPAFFKTSLGDPGVQKTEWNVAESYFSTFTIVGFFVFLGVIFLAHKQWKEDKSFKNPEQKLLFLLGTFLFVLFAGVAKGRVSVLGPRYLLVSTYYFYFSTFVGIVFLASFLKQGLQSKNSKPFVWGLSIWVGIVAVSSFWRTQERLQLTYNKDQSLSKIVSKVRNWIQDHPQYCYAGTLLNQVDSMTLNSALYRKSCAFKKGQAAIFTVDARGVGYMLQVPELKKVAVEWPKGERFIASHSPDIKMGVFSTVKDYRPVSISAKVSHAGIGGLAFGIREKDDFATIVFGPEKISAIQQKGNTVKPLLPDYTVGNADNTEIEIRKMGGLLLLLKDRVILGSIPSAVSLEGKIGLYAWDNNQKTPVFTDVQVTESTDESQFKIIGQL